MCCTTHLEKVKFTMVRFHTLQMHGVKIMELVSTLPANPEKGLTGKCNIKCFVPSDRQVKNSSVYD